MITIAEATKGAAPAVVSTKGTKAAPAVISTKGTKTPAEAVIEAVVVLEEEVEAVETAADSETDFKNALRILRARKYALKHMGRALTDEEEAELKEIKHLLKRKPSKKLLIIAGSSLLAVVGAATAVGIYVIKSGKVDEVLDIEVDDEDKENDLAYIKEMEALQEYAKSEIADTLKSVVVDIDAEDQESIDAGEVVAS